MRGDEELRLLVRRGRTFPDTFQVSALLRRGMVVEALTIMLDVDPIDARDKASEALAVLRERGGMDARIPALEKVLASALEAVTFWDHVDDKASMITSFMGDV